MIAILIFALFWTKGLFAMCPICAIAVGAGVGLSRWLGIDDTVTGVWVGGLIVSMIIWTIDWLKKKKWIFMRMELLISFGYFLLVVTPLYSSGIIGQLYNTLWGIDKLIVGIIFGAIGFWLIATLYNRMKARNNGHANFPFQKVVMPLAALTIISVCFYFITK